MQRSPNEAGRSAWLGISVATLLAFSILYCVSYAPLARWNAGNPPESLRPAYGPLRWLAVETPLKWPLYWWSDLWGSNPPGSPDFSELMQLIISTVEPSTGDLVRIVEEQPEEQSPSGVESLNLRDDIADDAGGSLNFRPRGASFRAD